MHAAADGPLRPITAIAERPAPVRTAANVVDESPIRCVPVVLAFDEIELRVWQPADTWVADCQRRCPQTVLERTSNFSTDISRYWDKLSTLDQRLMLDFCASSPHSLIHGKEEAGPFVDERR